MAVLTREFYLRDTTYVAQQLLGKRLVRRTREGSTAGRIVEVEAYLHRQDPACHAARGRTRSNAAMFGSPGRAYVYPIHSRYCFNTVTQPRGTACAVLIRAIEPLGGIELMKHRRGRTALTDLARGPARLCEAFAIDRQLDHWDLTLGQRLWIDDDCAAHGWSLANSMRIGVTSGRELLMRYYMLECPYVSGSRKLNDPAFLG